MSTLGYYLDTTPLLQLNCGRYLALTSMTHVSPKSLAVINLDGSLRYKKMIF